MQEIETSNDSTNEGIVNDFPIVGIGASAGGLSAFEAFFSGILDQTLPDMAFVLVQHLSPEYKSILPELVSKFTHLSVFTVVDGITVENNCVYVIPENCEMKISGGILHLFPYSDTKQPHMPIDVFFISLANDLQERAIGIILAGTGSDGSRGILEIKEKRGIVLVQKLGSTVYDGMPRKAIETGRVDFELLPEEMAIKLTQYTVIKDEQALSNIFDQLYSKTGNDFSKYKRNTIYRRIQRRMDFHQIKTMETYTKFMEDAPQEIEILFHELLIGVTDFFRDVEVFDALEKIGIPQIFDGKLPGSVIRVWIPGCSTAEEVYSIVILLIEYMTSYQVAYKLQIFATDIDESAITRARSGLFSVKSVEGISSSRLERFFSKEADGRKYRIQKEIRDLIVFSVHNVFSDPAFSKIDFISCRNLLIYMNGELQRMVLPIFAYALNSGGLLLLGTSETVGEFENIFKVLDRKARLYIKKGITNMLEKPILNHHIQPQPLYKSVTIQGEEQVTFPAKRPLREMTEQAMLKQSKFSSALVNERGDILYLHGQMGKYLEFIQGETGINNILKMTKDVLKYKIANGLHKAVTTNEDVSNLGIGIVTGDKVTTVNLYVTLVPSEVDESFLYLVMIEETSVLVGEAHWTLEQHKAEPQDNALIDTFKAALQSSEDYLHHTNMKLELTNQELKSSNEEMQSLNEELQASNEELETSKEELQSVNEELSTVNTELQTRLSDVSWINVDMNNLLAGTGIGIVFVDYDLNLLRFTPTTKQMINLIQSDIGRPIGHIVHNLLNYTTLIADIEDVLYTLIRKDLEVETIDHKWFAMSILPYRTIQNIIEGAVITFVDITPTKKIEKALTQSEMKYRRLFETTQEGILILDAETGKILDVNPFLNQLLGYSKEQFLEKKLWDIGLFKDVVENQTQFLKLKQENYVRYEHLPIETSDGRCIEVEFISNVYDVEGQTVIQCDIRSTVK